MKLLTIKPESLRRLRVLAVVGGHALLGITTVVILTVSLLTVVIKIKLSAGLTQIGVIQIVAGLAAYVGIIFSRLSMFFMLFALEQQRIRRSLWKAFSLAGILFSINIAWGPALAPTQEIEYPLVTCFIEGAAWMWGLLLFRYLNAQDRGSYRMTPNDRKLGLEHFSKRSFP